MQEDRRAESWISARSIATDATGRFTFLNVQPDESHSLYGGMGRLGVPGALAARTVQSADHGGEVPMGDLPVEESHSLSGRVELADGADIPAGSSVILSRTRAWDFQVVSLGPGGTLELTDLPAEAYTLEAVVAGYRHSSKNWSFDPLNETGLEGRVATSIAGLNVLMEAGPSNNSAAFHPEIVRRFIRRREQVLGGTKPRPVSPASRLLVATKDGSLQCLELSAGSPGESVTTLDLGEPLRFLAQHPTLPIVYALGDEHLMAVRWSSGSELEGSLGAGPGVDREDDS